MKRYFYHHGIKCTSKTEDAQWSKQFTSLFKNNKPHGIVVGQHVKWLLVKPEPHKSTSSRWGCSTSDPSAHLMHLGKHWKMARVVVILYPHRGLRWNFWLQPSPAAALWTLEEWTRTLKIPVFPLSITLLLKYIFKWTQIISHRRKYFQWKVITLNKDIRK